MRLSYPLHYNILSRIDHGNLPHILTFNPITRRLFIQNHQHNYRQRRLVFVISSGRSGSGFLADLLSLSPDTYARHEPRPRINGHYLGLTLKHGLAATYKSRLLKVFGINLALSRLIDSITYVETSHMFIKTYHDVVIDYYEQIDVIILRRAMSKVLRSFAELNYFSPNAHHWQKWMNVPEPSNCFAEPIGLPYEMDKYDRCIAYLLDMEARAQTFIEHNQKARIHEIRLEEITKVEGARKLYNVLALTYPDGLNMSLLEKNQALDAKDYHNNSISLDYCRKRLEIYLEKAHQQDRKLPDLSKVRI